MFSEEEKAQIVKAVQHKYEQVADSAAGKFKYETGRKGALALGYDLEILEEMEDEVLESFCGVGNPFVIWDVQQGESILDIGCGAGFDLLVARYKVGKNGKVCGVDLTPEMLAKAQRNFTRLGFHEIETKQITSEKLPYDDNSFDAVLSNGVINLSPAKAELFTEIYRVLKPGGRVQIADIVLDTDSPSPGATSLEAWAQ